MGKLNVKNGITETEAFDIVSNAGDASDWALSKGVISAPNIADKKLADAALLVAWSTVGVTRDKALCRTDTQLTTLLLPDSYPATTPIAKRKLIDALKTYRQALRDITKQPDPTNITWPTPPA